MSIFVSTTSAPRPKTKNIRSVSILLTGVFTIVAVSQLFSFEDFPARLAGIGIVSMCAPILATFIVVTEVLALPFVLGMPLSFAFRILSMVCGWLAAAMLLTVAVVENIVAPSGEDAVFGAVLPLPVGLWSICAAFAFCVLVAWVSWGMWPLKAKE